MRLMNKWKCKGKMLMNGGYRQKYKGRLDQMLSEQRPLDLKM